MHERKREKNNEEIRKGKNEGKTKEMGIKMKRIYTKDKRGEER